MTLETNEITVTLTRTETNLVVRAMTERLLRMQSFGYSAAEMKEYNQIIEKLEGRQ